jgi:RNA polymerase sigma-70 factor (ECF subfamily)
MFREGALEEFSWAPPSPSSQVEREGDLSRLQEALRHLPDREREAIDLRHVQGMTYREVACVLGIKESTVRTLIWKGIKRLRTQQEGSGDGLS